jgi:hypothetical protein
MSQWCPYGDKACSEAVACCAGCKGQASMIECKIKPADWLGLVEVMDISAEATKAVKKTYDGIAQIRDTIDRAAADLLQTKFVQVCCDCHEPFDDGTEYLCECGKVICENCIVFGDKTKPVDLCKACAGREEAT